MSKVTRIVILEDHAIVREGLVLLLEEEPDLQVVGQAGSGREALALIDDLTPDIALLDISMPGMDGLEVARLAAANHPEVRVLFLTMHDEEAFFFEALRVGAVGYVLKGSGSEELLTAIHAALRGSVHLPARLTAALVKDALASEHKDASGPALTPREREVAQLIAKGYTNSQIAERLTLSLNTVKTHRLHIYQKLELHDRAGLVRYALRHGLLSS